jgi:cytochrome P450
LRARDRILDTLRAVVRDRRTSPKDDGLSRILAAATASGTPLSDEDAALEAHHIVIAGYIVYAELAAMVQQLTNHPAVRERLAEEIAAKAPDGDGLTLEKLMSMPYLLQVVNEVKRLCPIIPAVFGKSKESFQLDGVTIPAGWLVMWALRPSHVGQSVYSDAERFDPDRFSPERAEDKRHEHAFVPHGAGPAMGHRCPGLDYATYFMAVFAIVLLRRHTWELPPQSFEVDWSKTPPDVKDGLRARVTRES